MFDFNIEKTNDDEKFFEVSVWDLLIIGGGPAGMNAGLYAQRKGLLCGIVTSETGGQLHNTSIVDNYLGFTLIEGDKLAAAFLKHVENLEVPILKGVKVLSLSKKEEYFYLSLENGRILKSKTVLITTGGSPRKLNIPGEEEFANKGVTYCATCDGPFFKDKHVVVAGGGNSAVEGVIDLVPWARKITIVHRSQFRADEVLLSRLKEINNLEINLETQILAAYGNDFLEGIKVLDKSSNEIRNIETDGLLIEIGTIPNSYLVKELVKMNQQNEIIVDEQQMTSLPGLFAAGDVTSQPFKQITISTAEGAKAALAIKQFLNKKI